MISGHRGVFSLGLLAAVGSLSVLLSALFVLPACLRLTEKYPDLKLAAQGLWGWRRRLEHLGRKEAQ
jgi:predicted RND superfamily exporter protein